MGFLFRACGTSISPWRPTWASPSSFAMNHETRAICAELAAETTALRDIIQARNRRRWDLRHTLQDRSRTVGALLEAHRGAPRGDETAVADDPAITPEDHTVRVTPPRLKRYLHE
jgi:putative transposase